MNKKPKGKDDALNVVVRRALQASAILLAWLLFSPSVEAQNIPPTANAGADRSVVDTDGLPGETAALDGSASSDADGTIVSYVWTNAQGVTIATGPTPTVRLPDGTNVVTLTVTDDYSDNSCEGRCDPGTDSDSVTITVLSSTAPVANAGGSRTIADTDKLPGERITLDGSASTDPDGTIVSYQWYLGENTLLGSGAVVDDVSLPDGDNQIRLVVTDNAGNTDSDVVTLTVGQAAARKALASLPELSPNQASTATNLDNLCLRLAERALQQTLPADQADLLNRCNGIIFDPSTDNQVQAIDELGAQDLTALRTQGLQFASAQFQSVSDRLIALRRGDSSFDVAGLQLSIDGKTLPLEWLTRNSKQAQGGGASADDATNTLLDQRWGFWLRGNYNDGKKTESAASRGFKSQQWGVTGGADYRLTDDVVLGGSFGYGKSDLSYNPSGQGGLDATSLTLSFYGSSYFAGDFYVDGVLNYGHSSYDSARRILYVESGSVIDRTAVGSTNGTTASVGLSGGYDFTYGGFTVAPNVGYFYVRTDIDGFREFGASGLDLKYDEQSYGSSTANAGVRAVYAWKLPWAVLSPHLSLNYVHEFRNDVEVFGVRFANDPFADSSDPTPPIIVRSDDPDQSYFKFAAGIAAQFKYDVSAYIEYQRYEEFKYVEFQGVTLGLRIQHGFR